MNLNDIGFKHSPRKFRQFKGNQTCLYLNSTLILEPSWTQVYQSGTSSTPTGSILARLPEISWCINWSEVNLFPFTRKYVLLQYLTLSCVLEKVFWASFQILRCHLTLAHMLKKHFFANIYLGLRYLKCAAFLRMLW